MKKILFFLIGLLSLAGAHAQSLTGKVVFSHYSTGVAAALSDSIFTLDHNGSLSFVTFGYRPRLSHNGKLMAFTNGPRPNDSYSANIWMRDLVAMHDTMIVSNADYLDYYDFSPNDSQIVYSQSCSMYTANINGTNAYHDINCAPCDCYSDDPTVNTIDSAIVFHNVHYGIYTKNFDGSNVTAVPHTYPGDLYPVWSPDGHYIAYLKSIPGAGYYTDNLYRIKFDGSDSTALTNFPTTDTIAPDPVWAGDMQTVFVIARISDTLGIYRIAADGSGTYSRLYLFNPTGSVFDYWMGLADSISSTAVLVNICDSIHADFNYSSSAFTYSFTDLSTVNGGTVSSRSWNFGDSFSSPHDTSSLANPVHRFSSGGTYTVCEIITGSINGATCTDTVCKTISVANVCDSLTAMYTETQAGQTATFTNTSTAAGGLNITTHQWNFDDAASGNNDSASTLNATHTFAANGEHNVCLTVTALFNGGNDSCTAIYCQTFTITGVGIENISANSVALYPNPAKDEVLVKAGFIYSSVSLYDGLGREVLKQFDGSNIIHLPAGITNGIYFLHFKTGSGNIVSSLAVVK